MSAIVREAPILQPWFATPFYEKILRESSFSKIETEQIQQYANHGYLVIDPEIDNIDEIARVLRDDIPYPIHDGKPYNRVQDHWRHNETVKKLACHPKVLETLEFLYQRPAIPFQTLNFPVGTEQATHSDTIHFNSIPERWMCGVWIALEDVDHDNGPLHYYPGSHKLPIFSMHDIGLSPQDYTDLGQSYPIYERIVGEMLEAGNFERKEVHLKKGQGLIWEANLYHGGSLIRDRRRTRLTQVTHYYFGGAAYYGPLQSDAPLGKMVWRQVENITDGRPIQHAYNGKPVTAPMFNGSPQMLKIIE